MILLEQLENNSTYFDSNIIIKYKKFWVFGISLKLILFYFGYLNVTLFRALAHFKPLYNFGLYCLFAQFNQVLKYLTLNQDSLNLYNFFKRFHY